jgi:hypothetical protein
MTSVIRLERVENFDSYKAYWENGAFLGDIINDVDGYYKFYPTDRGGGYLDEWFLYSMYVTLKDLNKKWDKQIHDYFSGLRDNDTQQGKSI